MAIFQDLNEDILLTVLSTCDVRTVLRASQVNKLIHALALSKPVWVALVADLIARCIMDAFSDPDFANYSAPQLHQIVKRLLSVESADISSTQGGSSWSADVKLLPGGRFFTLESYDGRLQCWSLETGLCVWTYSQKRRTGYAVDIIDRGNTARFLLPGSSKDSFIIEQVDLTTGSSLEIFRMPRRDEIRWWNDGDVSLSGDFVILTIHIHRSWVVLLINWREDTYINFHQGSTGLVVVRGHIVLGTATLNPPHRSILFVYNKASLAAHWRPLTDWPPTATHAFDIQNIQQCSGPGPLPSFIENPGHHKSWQAAPEGVLPVSQGMRLALWESPVQRDTYALSFVLYEEGKFPSWDMSVFHRSGHRFGLGAILVTYHLSISQQGLQLVHASALPTLPMCKSRNISYARYAIINNGVEDVNSRRQESKGEGILGPIVWESIHLSPTSGANLFLEYITCTKACNIGLEAANFKEQRPETGCFQLCACCCAVTETRGILLSHRIASKAAARAKVLSMIRDPANQRVGPGAEAAISQ
ncbi:hypothetical protein C8R45DRAFT_1134938 [Mycena sanguinolenta]|nr:hypothetical protein C8R45DRAFT_1134938 [Mycena sanguinolenta]